VLNGIFFSFHSSRVNTVQLAALTCLTFISMFSAAQTAFETAGVDVSKTGVLAAVVYRAHCRDLVASRKRNLH
jgi:hypothetical protein